MNPIIVFITVFLGLATLGLFLIYCEERKQDKRGRVRMDAYAAMYESKHSYKPIHEVI